MGEEEDDVEPAGEDDDDDDGEVDEDDRINSCADLVTRWYFLNELRNVTMPRTMAIEDSDVN